MSLHECESPIVNCSDKKVSRIRFLHNVASKSGFPIDVYLDGFKINPTRSIVYAEATPYFCISSGKHQLAVLTNTEQAEKYLHKFQIKKKRDYTIILMGNLGESNIVDLSIKGSITLSQEIKDILVDDKNQGQYEERTPDHPDAGRQNPSNIYMKMFKDNNSYPGNGRVRFGFIHGAAGLPNVDIYLDNNRAFKDVKYSETYHSRYRQMYSDTYTIKIMKTKDLNDLKDSEDLELISDDIPLRRGHVYTAVSTGGSGGYPIGALILQEEPEPYKSRKAF